MIVSTLLEVLYSNSNTNIWHRIIFGNSLSQHEIFLTNIIRICFIWLDISVHPANHPTTAGSRPDQEDNGLDGGAGGDPQQKGLDWSFIQFKTLKVFSILTRPLGVIGKREYVLDQRKHTEFNYQIYFVCLVLTLGII